MKLFITTNNIVKKEDLKKAFKSYEEFNQYIDSVINSTGLKSFREVIENSRDEVNKMANEKFKNFIANGRNENESIDTTTIQIIKRMLKGEKKPKSIVITTKLYRFEVSGDNCFIIEPLVYLTYPKVSDLNYSQDIEKELILNISDIEEFKLEF